MAVNARTEEFQHIEVFDKPALFTNGRIARDTVPKGWYCYDIRGSDDDPGELCYMEENVVVNHAGSVLMPEKLAMPKSGRLDVRDELGFLDEGDMTLREFCEAHQLPYPAENMKSHIRPARPEEAGLFYTPHPEEDTAREARLPSASMAQRYSGSASRRTASALPPSIWTEIQWPRVTLKTSTFPAGTIMM